MNQNDILVVTAYEDYENLDPAQPEKELMRAVLVAAMDDMRKTGEPYREARRYFLSNEERYLFSFLSVCIHLNLCPRTIRRLLGLIGGEAQQADLAA